MEDKKTEMIYSNPEADIFRAELEDAYDFRKRRHSEWTDNYLLLRNRIITNRITQRQTIVIPLMKYTLNTILKDVDELPQLYFKNLDNDKQKELFYNEYWSSVVQDNSLEIRDVADKKNAFTYGRSFLGLNIVDGGVKIPNIDTNDLYVHRFTDPLDLDSSPCVIQTKIYRRIKDVIRNKKFDKGGRDALSSYISTTLGKLELSGNVDMVRDRNERLTMMGVADMDAPSLSEDYVELSQMYRYEYDSTKGNIIFVSIFATIGDQRIFLLKKPLCDVLGNTSSNFWYNHLPLETWGADTESVDFWSDGIADIIRPVNIILNTWISQLVENRTLRNFGMTFYDSSNEKFIPQIFEPESWGFYPVPGNPNDILKSVEIPDLSESIDEIKLLMDIAEKATAATSANAGAVEDRKVTLGEVQLALANAEDRVKSMQKLYREMYKRLGVKYVHLLEGAGDKLDPKVITKKGRATDDYYSKEVSETNWRSKSGYTVVVKIQEDKQSEDLEKVQKLRLLKADMPDNRPLVTIYNKKLMEFAGLTAEESKQVEDFEREKMQGVLNGPLSTPIGGSVEAPVKQPMPITPVASVENSQMGTPNDGRYQQ